MTKTLKDNKDNKLYTSIAEQLVDGTAFVNSFPAEKFAQRLHYKATQYERTAEFKSHNSLEKGNAWPDSDPSPGSKYIADFDCKIDLEWLAEVSFAKAIKEVDGRYSSRIDLTACQKVYDEIMIKLTYLSFLEHLNMVFVQPNHQIVVEDGTKLKDILLLRWKYEEFGEFLFRYITEPAFMEGILQQDFDKGNGLHMLCLLFLVDYTSEIAGRFRLDTTEDFVLSQRFEVLKTWSYNLWCRKKDDKEHLKKVMAFCGYSATAVYCGSDRVQPSSTYNVTVSLYKLIHSKGASDTKYLKDVGNALNELMQDDLKIWNSISVDLSRAWTKSQYPRWRDAVIRENSIENFHTTEWIQNGYTWEKRQSEESTTRKWHIIYPPNTSLAYHFVEGAQISLANGTECRAENLRRSDTVLTSAQPLQWSNISGEIERRQGSASLIGFNKEEPFTTAAQVFHTTTGLRAVEPDAARAQNPWLHVGQLTEGHIVYRLRPGHHTGYELFEIESIHRTIDLKRNMYTVRLEDDSRALHVDRFLVNVNRPGMNAVDVASILKPFPLASQIKLLSSTAEVQSLARKYGSQTVQSRLLLELEDHAAMSVPSLSSFSHTTNMDRKLLQGLMTESYQEYRLKTKTPKDDLPVRDLPIVSTIDGVLSLDHKVQLRAMVDHGEHNVTWTRQIDQSTLWEHGWLSIYRDGNNGQGVLHYSESPEPKSLEDGQIIQIEAQRSDHFDRDTSDQEYSQSATLSRKSEFVTKVDRKVWNKGQTLSKLQDPIAFDSVFSRIYKEVNKPKMKGVVIPFLDKLLAAINQARDPKEGLDRLYTSYVETYLGKNNEGQQKLIERWTVDFHNAAIVKDLSDQSADKTSFSKLTFSKLLGHGSPIELPVLFQKLYFVKSTNGRSIEGALHLFDPWKRECKGERHKISGTWKKQDLAAEHRQRTAVSKAFAELGSPGQDPRLRPSSITHLLSTAAEVTVDTLMDLSYVESEVHSKSQTAIMNTMYYHMDDKQREGLTTRVKPQLHDLSDELTTDLSPHLKKFLKETYAPAFIARNVSQIQQYSDKFREGESDKIWYWFAGQGKNCLPKSREYQELNNLASIFAMKSLHPELDRLSKSDASELAEGLIKQASDEAWLENISQSGDSQKQINKICVLLNTLVPEKNYAEKLYDKLTKSTLNDAIQTVRLSDGKQTENKKFLEDIMGELIRMILSGDPSISGDVQKQLLGDLEDFMKANDINLHASLQEKLNNILTLMSAFTVEVANLISIAIGGSKRAFGGSKLFHLAGKLVDQASAKVDKVKFGKKLAKGFGAICVASYFVGLVLPMIGIIKNWDSLSDAQRATAILETTRVVIAATDKAIKSYKTWAAQGSKPETTLVESAVLNEALEETIVGEKGTKLVNLADGADFKAEGGHQVISAERFNKGKNVSSEDKIPGNEEIWDEDINDKSPKTMAGEEETASKLSVTSKWLRGLNICIGFAVSAIMTFSLVHDWDKMTDAGKIIDTLAVAVQILSVVIDVANLAIEAGLIASATLTAAIPVVGAVLAIVGIVLMIVSLFYDPYKKGEVPDIVKNFMNDVARKLITLWTSPPKPKFQYAVNPTEVKADQRSKVSVKATNKEATKLSLRYTQISIWTGHEDDCFFAEEEFYRKDDTEQHDSGGKIMVDTPEAVKLTLDPVVIKKNVNKPQDMSAVVSLSCTGTKGDGNPLGYLRLETGKSFETEWTGMINKAGKSFVEVVERFIDGDIARVSMPVLRK